MVKLVIEIKETKDGENCNVTIKGNKDLTKATINEKKCLSVVRSNIEKCMENLKN